MPRGVMAGLAFRRRSLPWGIICNLLGQERNTQSKGRGVILAAGFLLVNWSPAARHFGRVPCAELRLESVQPGGFIMALARRFPKPQSSAPLGRHQGLQ